MYGVVCMYLFMEVYKHVYGGASMSVHSGVCMCLLWCCLCVLIVVFMYFHGGVYVCLRRYACVYGSVCVYVRWCACVC